MIRHPAFDAVVAEAPAPEVIAHLFGCVQCRVYREAWYEEPPLLDGAIRTRDAYDRRFVVKGELGQGGMGDVLLAEDTWLARDVAVKILRPDRNEPAIAQRLVAEARLTARLQHPSIAPIYALGQLDDGRPFYATRVVHGRMMREVVQDWGDGPVAFRKAVELIRRTGEVVAYAHTEAVVHGDIKPDNVLIGPFDDLVLIDFGISSASSGEGGRLAGTAAYLAPEALDRVPMASPRDVYALGVMLYELLAQRLPYAGPPDEVLRQLRSGDAPPPPGGPPDLARVCVRAMAFDPGQRPTAHAFAAELGDWLSGQRRMDEAKALVAEAQERGARATALRAEAQRLREAAEDALAALPERATVADKAEAWALEDAAGAAELEADVAEAQVEQRLTMALGRWTDLPEAREALDKHWWERLRRAEIRRDGPAVRRWEARLREAGRGDWLDAPVEVSVRTDPPGLAVVARRYTEEARRLVAGAPVALGVTPLVASLPPGSWRLELDGDPRLAIAANVRRGEPDPMRDPDGEVVVHRVPSLGAEDCWVPAGWAQLGGDEHAGDAFPPLRLWVDGFVMRRFPVTNGEYQEFLDDLCARGRSEEAGRHAPVLAIQPQSWRWTSEGWRPPPEHGADFPVALVDFDGACAYAAWAAERDALPWRLPTEYEWEKAARGADGRLWPWGDHFHGEWARTIHAPQRAETGPVQSFPEDVSTFGVRGTVGGVRDWTASPWTKRPAVAARARAPRGLQRGEYQVVRGGAYHNTQHLCRPATRFGNPPGQRFQVIGFRLAR